MSCGGLAGATVASAARVIGSTQAMGTVNQRAWELQKADAVLIRGPVYSRDGKSILVPSPRWSQAAIDRWKAARGRFKETEGLYDIWTIPVGQMTLREADRVYRECYQGDISAARSRLAMSNLDLRRRAMCDAESKLESEMQEQLERIQEQGE